MADFAKKIEKQRARLLDPTEVVLAATMIQPKGAYKKQTVAAGLGGVAGALIAQKMTAKSGSAVGGLAAAMPATRALAVLTDQRLVVVKLGSMMNSVKDVACWWSRAQIAHIGFVKEGKLVNLIGIAFIDGSSVDVESVRGGNPKALVEAFTAQHLPVAS